MYRWNITKHIFAFKCTEHNVFSTRNHATIHTNNVLDLIMEAKHLQNILQK